jgi:hypothetical protein
MMTKPQGLAPGMDKGYMAFVGYALSVTTEDLGARRC